MAEEELDAAVRATQASLGRFVKRPPLTDKLLRKPPFRFLHDIVTAVIKSNGVFEGLFDENELKSDNVKERDAKISFLTKVITVLSTTIDQNISAKPSKIIAGQEPEKTNELLQCLGFVLEQNLSTKEAVTKYKRSLKTPQSNENNIRKKRDHSKDNARPKEEEKKKLTSRSSEKLTQRDKKEAPQVKREVPKERDKSLSRKQDKVIPKQNSVDKTTKVSPPKRTTNAPRLVTSNTKVLTNEAGHLNKKQLKKSDLLINEDSKHDTDESTEPKELLIAIHDEPVPLSTYVLRSDESEVNLLDNVVPDNNSNDNDNSEELHTAEQMIKEPKTNDNKPENKSDNGRDNKNKTDENSQKDQMNGKATIEISPKRDIVRQRELTEIIKRPISDTKPPSILDKRNIEIIKPESQTSKPEALSSKPEGLASEPEGLPSKTDSPANISKAVPRPPSVRPPSARPGAPRLRDKHEDVLTSVEPVPMGKVNVIFENTSADTEDDEASLVIVESSDQQHLESAPNDDFALQYSSGDHGHLVQQILDSQKEFTQMKSGKTDIEWEFGVQKAREASGQEVELTRFSLQALSRAANPLGKLLDHIQEDVEVMRQELQQWSTMYEEASTELTRQKSSNEQSLQPLQAKIKQLDSDIMEKRDKINDIKSVIHKNTLRINKLLASGDLQ